MTHISARINPVIAPLQQRWHALEPRQQNWISLGVTVVVLLLILAYLWLPAMRERQRMRELLPQTSAHLEQMKLQLLEFAQLNANTSAVPARTSADSAQLQALFGEGARVSLDANRAFRVVIPKIAYAVWWDRVNDAQSRFPLRITTLSVQALPGGNREVSVDMTLADASRPVATVGTATK